MAARRRDSQVQRLYAAEKVLRAGMSKPVTTWKRGASKDERKQMIKDAQAFIDRVMARKYIKRKYPNASRFRIMVRGTKARRQAVAWTVSGTIDLPFNGEWGWHEDVLLHEVAHILDYRDHWRYEEDRAYHDWRFAQIYLDLVRNVMGKEAHDALRKSFKKHRVRYTEPRKRTMTAEQREALQERMKLAREARKLKPLMLSHLKSEGYLLDHMQPLKRPAAPKPIGTMTYTELKAFYSEVKNYVRPEPEPMDPWRVSVWEEYIGMAAFRTQASFRTHGRAILTNNV
jgi:putative metallohydrolase (TIGR04338 family)